jgi:uncharacterized protein (TIGR03083 family)
MTAPTGYTDSPAGYAALSHGDALAHLAERQSVFADLLATADLDAPVPTCPGWTVTNLAHHLGTVHRWAAGAVREGRPVDLEETGPTDRDALVDWYREGADGLTALLTATDEAAEVWSFGPKPRTARFWSRRQAHETAMHTEDLGLAAGALPPLPADLALDGVDEVVTMFFPRQVHLQRTVPLDRSLALVPDGAGARWVLAGDGGTVSDDVPEAEATVAGPAQVLVRLLWQRVTLDAALAAGVTLDGDEAAARTVLGARLTP